MDTGDPAQILILVWLALCHEAIVSPSLLLLNLPTPPLLHLAPKISLSARTCLPSLLAAFGVIYLKLKWDVIALCLKSSKGFFWPAESI